MKITNKKAHFDYEIIDTYDVGIILTGAEVKSVKGERITLEGSFVKFVGNELYLVNAQIYPYSFAPSEGYDPKRSRKLLLHKKEIISLKTKMASTNLTLVPLECYNSHGFIKLKIGLAKGKREFEKREKIKKRDENRNIARIIRGKTE